MLITQALIEAIRRQYRLDWNGIHGMGHWARVLENGRRIAEDLGGASIEVVELFAVFHDAARWNESLDDGHGLRGAELARKLRGSLFELPDEEFALLYRACAEHTEGRTYGNVVLQVCWDADRLDLGRAGIVPDPARLCTEAARQAALLAWADERARRRFVPEFAVEEWLAGSGSEQHEGAIRDCLDREAP